MPQTPPNKFSSVEDLTTLSSRYKRMRPDDSPQTSPKYSNQENEMMGILTKLLAEVTELRKSQCEMQKSLEFHIKNYEDMNTRITSLEEEKQDRESYIFKLEHRIDELERHTRSTCLEIRGIQSKPGETKQDMLNLIEKLLVKTNAQIQTNAIKDIFRLNRNRSGERPILVDFNTTLQKTQILQAVKKYNSTNTTNRLNTTSIGIEGEKLPIYVSEFLTPKAKKLFYLAREATKSIQYDFCWTVNGRILMRKTEGLPPVTITSEKQLEDLKQKN